MGTTLTVAALQPRLRSHDVAGNVLAHAEAVRGATARLVVFPELSLTGYELGADAVEVDDPVLAPLVQACAVTGSTALAGAPHAGAAGETIAFLRVDSTGADVAYRKQWLSAAEAERFVPGHEPGILEVDGWRIVLGLCKDTGAMQHLAQAADLRPDVYVAGLVHGADEVVEQDARGRVIAAATGGYVVFSSFAGPTGSGYSRTAGSSCIWSRDGQQIARATPHPGSSARAELTLASDDTDG